MYSFITDPLRMAYRGRNRLEEHHEITYIYGFMTSIHNELLRLINVD